MLKRLLDALEKKQVLLQKEFGEHLFIYIKLYSDCSGQIRYVDFNTGDKEDSIFDFDNQEELEEWIKSRSAVCIQALGTEHQ